MVMIMMIIIIMIIIMIKVIKKNPTREDTIEFSNS